MLEHLSFKSTKNLKAGEFDEIVKGFGGVNNASTSFDYTRYFIKSSTENLDKSLALFAELMSNLLLKEDEFLPERNVVAEERLWRTDNSPMGYLYFRFFNTAFVYHPYHWTPIGFMEDIQSWQIADIASFYHTYYQPQNAIILVSGDVNPNEVFESATKHFAPLKNTVPIPEVKTKEPRQDGIRRSIVKKDSQVEFLAMGYKIPNFLSKDQVALSAIGDILSGGKSSILSKELVDKQQIASSVYAYNMELKDDGVFLIMATAKQGIKAESIEKEVYKVLENLKQGKITQEELEKVKINTRASFIYGLENASSVAGLFGSYLVRGDISPLLSYERDINALSIDKIKEVANKYFVEDSLNVVILRDKDKSEAQE
ncbi:pitrilysin family protein, partial [uncultured Helicobacter sp.]